MFQKYRTAIVTQLNELTGISQDVLMNAIDTPRILEHGDLAIAVPKLRAKGNPVQLAKEWSEKFVTNDLILKTNSAGPFINFSINKKMLKSEVLTAIFNQGEKYGFNNSCNGKRVLLDFSSPNIAKPFHAGHLRSTIIGNFITNLFKANGCVTTALNYLGDWGKQYGLLAIGFEHFGNEEELAKDPIKHLYDVYVQINAEATEKPEIHDQARAYFKRMEDGDEEALKVWKRFRDLSIVKYKETYAKLNIHFDVYSGESQVSYGMGKAEKMLYEKNLVVDSEGAKLIDLEAYKLGKAVLQKRDGTSLYLTRDIGGAIERYDKYNFDDNYYIVSSQQDLHFKQLFKVAELLELPNHKNFVHINYGLVKGMSTRKGTVVFLNDIIEQTTESMHEIMRQNEKKYAQIEDPARVAEIVAISAIIIQDLSARRVKDYEFDWSRMLSFEGDTGPYLQYAHARLCSVERKTHLKVSLDADLSLLTEPEADTIIDLIAKYPDLLISTMSNLEPCSIVQYALKLSHAVSAAWENLWVVNQPDDIAQARLLMYYSARVVLGNALRLLGLTPLERM
ncbi:putative arginine-tRNA ligase, cytoplasmic [Smittium culicis]|uniref:arginine--tRNA ligase n=1 Tax=Smittium culicis TaxID=133412 RepID=A0A1R1X386_9FUNG|nr:putative arginine-tRNA ligase, cytoplasmic [Smittium culicis]OMJ17600.1 putative arginine-tRNA ligase, cytoplasmic [Smittium culicis]